MLQKSRQLAERFKLNPVWTVPHFEEEVETIEKLHAIFLSDGWSEPTPDARLTAKCVRSTMQFDLLEARKRTSIRVVKPTEWVLFGQKVYLGRLVYEYTDMAFAHVGEPDRGDADTVDLVITGSPDTLMTIRVAVPSDAFVVMTHSI